MEYTATINIVLRDEEVPALRESVGWEGRRQDYPRLFHRCNFWAGLRDEKGRLIAFGYICGMELEHGYMEDIIVHPAHQGKGLGKKLVRALLNEASERGLRIVTCTFAPETAAFYEKCGVTICPGGVVRYPFE